MKRSAVWRSAGSGQTRKIAARGDRVSDFAQTAEPGITVGPNA